MDRASSSGLRRGWIPRKSGDESSEIYMWRVGKGCEAGSRRVLAREACLDVEGVVMSGSWQAGYAGRQWTIMADGVEGARGDGAGKQQWGGRGKWKREKQTAGKSRGWMAHVGMIRKLGRPDVKRDPSESGVATGCRQRPVRGWDKDLSRVPAEEGRRIIGCDRPMPCRELGAKRSRTRRESGGV